MLPYHFVSYYHLLSILTKPYWIKNSACMKLNVSDKDHHMLLQHYTKGFFHWGLTIPNSIEQNAFKCQNLVCWMFHKTEDMYMESTNSGFKISTSWQEMAETNGHLYCFVLTKEHCTKMQYLLPPFTRY